MPVSKAAPKPAPKAAPKPAPKAAPPIEAEMVGVAPPPQPPPEADAPAKTKTVVSADKVKVANKTMRVVNLTHGSIKPGKHGIATMAELGTLSNYLERI